MVIDKTAVTKFIVRNLVRHGTASATANIVANARSTSDNEVVDTYHKFGALAGGYAAGWFVGDHIADFAVIKVDEAIAWFQANVNITKS